MLNLDDTIVAISTPPGEGGIGVVRLSGPNAVQIADQLFRSPQHMPLNQADSHRLYYGRLAHAHRALDEALVVVMRAPNSYTKEDVVEFQCHGSPVVLREVVLATIECGARAAEPGEFTQRAFLNGRLGLDQAQAVLDVIQAKTALSAHFALSRLEGKFSQPLIQMKHTLTELLAGVGVGLDYPEYEEDALPFQALIDGLRQAENAIQNVLSNARDGRLLRDGYAVTLAGKPNVGKSTLLNALLNDNRALVTQVAGTTRDTLEEWVEIAGVPFRLADTAGLHASQDEVERLGMARTKTAMQKADLVLVMLDLTQAPDDADRAVLAEAGQKPMMVLGNKSDDPAAMPIETICNTLKLNADNALAISAQTGAALDVLKDRLVRRVWNGELPKHENVHMLDDREQALLQRAQALVNQSLTAAEAGATLDLIAIDVQEALDALSELTGESASEAVIERIFANFCVGK